MTRPLATVVITVGFLSGCGGSSDSDSSNPKSNAPPPPSASAGGYLTGYFRVPTVAGLPYCSSICGTTGAQGDFQYRAGDKVSFHLRNIVFGTTPPLTADERVVTPWTLGMDRTIANNIARTLLMLRTDPSGPVAISAAVLQGADHVLDPLYFQTMDPNTELASYLVTFLKAALDAGGGPFVLPPEEQMLSELLPEFTCNYSGLYQGKFDGTTISLGATGSTLTADQTTKKRHISGAPMALLLLPGTGTMTANFPYQTYNDGTGAPSWSVFNVFSTSRLSLGYKSPIDFPVLPLVLSDIGSVDFQFASSAEGAWPTNTHVPGLTGVTFHATNLADPSVLYRFLAGWGANVYLQLEVAGNGSGVIVRVARVTGSGMEFHKLAGLVDQTHMITADDGELHYEGLLDTQTSQMPQLAYSVLTDSRGTVLLTYATPMPGCRPPV